MPPKVSYTDNMSEEQSVQGSDWAIEKEEREHTTIFWYLDKDKVFSADFYLTATEGLGNFFATLWFTADSTRVNIHRNNKIYRVTDRSVSIPTQTKEFAATVFREAIKKVSLQEEAGDE